MAFARFGDRGDHGVYGLARVLGGGVADEAGLVDGFCLAFLHAVGVEHEAVAGTQVEVLYLVGALRGDTERKIDVQRDFVDRAVAQPQRPEVAGADELAPVPSRAMRRNCPVAKVRRP